MIPVIGVATLSKYDLCQQLLDSIDFPVEHLIVVDNSGKKEFQPTLNDNINNFWLIQVPHGLGANGAWNLIIKSTPFAKYWVLPNDDAYFEPGALEKIHNNVDLEKFNFPNISPHWSCPIPTQGSVMKAGLWDEAFHPIYFDDDDYEWRMKKLGIEFNHIDAKVHHMNSATLNSGYQKQNEVTFMRNRSLLANKMAAEDLGVRGWSLKVRRENAWD